MSLVWLYGHAGTADEWMVPTLGKQVIYRVRRFPWVRGKDRLKVEVRPA